MVTADDRARNQSRAEAPGATRPASGSVATNGNVESDWNDGDLGDLLQELRVLLPGTQTLAAFLIILPFQSGFAQIQQGEKIVYLATFLCTLCSLVLFTAPAAQHRLQRPLQDREGFKNNATKLIVAGLVPLSLALVLATHLVIAQVLASNWIAWVAPGLVAVLIALVWWLHPIRRHADKTT